MTQPRDRSIRILTVFLGALAVFALLPGRALGNGGPVELHTGNGNGVAGSITPLRSEQIVLEREHVDLDVYITYTRGRVRYTLKNTGGPQRISFGFPTLVFNRWSSQSGDYIHYEIKADSKKLTAKKVRGKRFFHRTALTTYFPKNKPAGWKYSIFKYLFGNYDQYRMADLGSYHRMYQVTTIDFAAGQTRTVDIDFVVENFQKYGFALKHSTRYDGDPPFGTAYFSYLTHPAKNWKGRIKKAVFRMRIMGKPPWRTRTTKNPGVKVLPAPHKKKGNTYVWQYRNWEPKEDIRVLLPYWVRSHRELTRKTFSALPGLYGKVVSAKAIAKVWEPNAENLQPDSKRSRRSKRRARRYAPGKAFDGDPVNTKWMSKHRDNKGAGAALAVRFKSPQCIKGLALVTGHMGQSWDNGKSLYGWYSRPKTVTIEADGTKPIQVKLAENRVIGKRHNGGPFVLHLQTKYIDFGKQVLTRKLTVKVSEVYPGRKKRAPVVISEMAMLKGDKHCGQPNVAATNGSKRPSRKGRRITPPSTPSVPAKGSPATVARSGWGCSCELVAARVGAGLLWLSVIGLGLAAVRLRRRRQRQR